MPKDRYCLYSSTRGYLVKKIIVHEDYASYCFKNIHVFSENMVIIFDCNVEAEQMRKFWAQLGPLHKDDQSPVPDVRVRIAGTDTDLLLPEEY